MKTKPLMLALLGWVLLGATIRHAHAQGTIRYVNPPDHVIISNGSPTVFHDVDLDGNSTVDFEFRAGGSFNVYSTSGGRSIAIPKGGLDLGSWSIPLSEGSVIGPVTAPLLEWISSVEDFPGDWRGPTFHFADSLGTFGYWQPNMTSYLGVEFGINGGTHYGWVRLSTWFLEGVNGGIIEEWAYNLIPGQPILAGQVPEPGTVVLLAAGAGLLCWQFRRKRRPV